MPVLTRDTKITIGTAVAVVGLAIGSTWWVAERLNDTTAQLINIRSEIEGVTAKMTDLYKKSEASEQALRMALENPGLRVPDPRDPSKVFTSSTLNYVPRSTDTP